MFKLFPAEYFEYNTRPLKVVGSEFVESDMQGYYRKDIMTESEYDDYVKRKLVDDVVRQIFNDGCVKITKEHINGLIHYSVKIGFVESIENN
jgi:hypothetical protein